jgi:hypothetical protein
MFDERFQASTLDGGLAVDANGNSYWAPPSVGGGVRNASGNGAPAAAAPPAQGMQQQQQQQHMMQQQFQQQHQQLPLMDSSLLQSPLPPPLPSVAHMDELEDAFIVPHQQQQQQHNLHLHQQQPAAAATNYASSMAGGGGGGGLGLGLGGGGGPPAHLFSNNTFASPFHSAVFEVEGDLNGVNPSEHMQQYAAARRTQQQMFGGSGNNSTGYQMPSGPHRTQTGDSLLFAPQASSSPIGLLPPVAEPLLPLVHQEDASALAFDSLIDRAEAQAQQGRKRARLNAGGAAAQQQPAVIFDEERDLRASTFGYTNDMQSALASQMAAAGPGPAAATGRAASARIQQQQSQQHLLPPVHAALASVAPSQTSGTDSPTPLQSEAPTTTGGGGGGGGRAGGRGSNAVVGLTADKKEKHQLTDRQRRAKIKESMDALKAELPAEVAGAKADQATIVASSVMEMKRLKTEVEELREKLQALEMQQESEDARAESRRIELEHVARQQRMIKGDVEEPAPLSSAPFSSMMASLNGAGVAMMRMGLDGALVEVNLVFELVSGFRAADVIGHTPCHPPMFGSLSIMPSAFLKAFALVAPVPAPQPHHFQSHALPPGQLANSGVSPTQGSSGDGSASSQASTPNNMAPSSPTGRSTNVSPLGCSSGGAGADSPLTGPGSEPSMPPMHAVQRADSTGSGSNNMQQQRQQYMHHDSGSSGMVDHLRQACGPPDIVQPFQVTVPAQQQQQQQQQEEQQPHAGETTSHMSQTSVAPLYANASISNFPIVPQRSAQQST